MKSNGFSVTKRIVFIVSILLNIVFGFFAAKRIYFYLHKEPVAQSTTIKYFLNRQTVYDLFTVKPTDIVFAGDSHTQFFDTEDYLPGYPIKNRGIMGDVTLGLLKRIDEVVGGKPMKIFLEIGVNDVLDPVSPDSIVNRIGGVISAIQKRTPTTKLYVVSLFPSSMCTEKIPIVNSKLKAYCDKLGLPFIDVYGKISDHGFLNKMYDSGDHNHLNGQGYLVYASIIKPYL